jgi:hypothetical protein
MSSDSSGREGRQGSEPARGLGSRENLQEFAWIVSQQDDTEPHVERAYALSTLYVFRRETDLSQEHPRPRYWRASHRDVLANDSGWGELDESVWTEVDETGAPLPARS